mmetsp:Transcript_3524/g.8294  ORF Transcript_3524/g.8294 Transcript_3524/m.8294 type:complete len:357 (-) Transcript_3524:86-1156(-)
MLNGSFVNERHGKLSRPTKIAICFVTLAFGQPPLFLQSWLCKRARSPVRCRRYAETGLYPVRPEDRNAAGAELQLRFEREGFCHVTELLTVAEASSLAQELAHVQSSESCEMAALKHELRQHVGPHASSCHTVQECRRLLQSFESSGKVKFLQYFNLHRRSPLLRRAALSPRLGFWAARLLGVEKVRLYQDALFMKYPKHGPTRWHSDLGLSPFDTNAFVTVWLALTPVARKGGAGLRFAKGSHRDYTLQYHHDLAESYTQDDLSNRYLIEDGWELEPGDATWHHGWTLHAAKPLRSSARSPRVAWALSFVADGAKLLPREALEVVQGCEDAVSFQPWLRDLQPGDKAQHAMLPLL